MFLNMERNNKLMNNKSISRNYIYNLFYQILVIVLPLVTTPYLSRTLGAEAIGIYSYTLSIATYFVLFGSLGVSMYGQREIAYLQDDKKKRTIVFGEILLMRFITMGISLIIFGLTYVRSNQYRMYYTILTIELISQALDISWFFQGMEEFKKTVVRNSIVKIIFVISIFVFIKSPADLFKYILIATLANLIGNLSLWMYLRKFLDKIKLSELNILKHIKPAISLFIPQIAIQVYTVLDRTMIGKIWGEKSEVGYYEQAQKIIRLLLTIVTSLGAVMVPRMANTYAKGDKEQFKKYLFRSFNFTFLLAFPVMAGIILVSKEFVPIFFGKGYEKVAILIPVISPIVVFIAISNILGYQILLPTKKQKEYTISVTVGAIINFIFNLIFIWKFGAVGASISTVLAEFSVSAIQIFYARDIFRIRDMIKCIKNNFIATMVMVIITYGIKYLLGVTGVLSVTIQIFIGMVTYGISLLLLKDEFVFYLKDRLVNMVKARMLH